MPDTPTAPNERRAPPRALGLFKCRNCLKVKKKTRPWMRFCNSKCRNTFHNDNRKLEKVEDGVE
jgi:hypothetical protein